MTFIKGKPAEDWIEKNHPKNGVVRIYWKNIVGLNMGSNSEGKPQKDFDGEATYDEEEGVGLRYEWEYKDGKRADGISRGWYSNGQLKCEWTWKDGERNGLQTQWNPDGTKEWEGYYKDGKKHGLRTWYYGNGQKKWEGVWKNGEQDGVWTHWYDNGEKQKEETFKDDKLISKKEWNRLRR
tara:strand:- start:166 stop:708 length:543 start_codon:yes stop_codon:yes gene_type:complete